MINAVVSIIQQLERIIRNGVSGVDSKETADLLHQAYKLCAYYSQDNSAALIEGMDAEKSISPVSYAVKLHNKARNLTAPLHTELRTILKATAAWILSVYSDKNPKISSVIIKLLSKASQEISLLSSREDLSLKAADAAIRVWLASNQMAIQKLMAPIEMQEIKIAIFNAYIEKAKISSVLGYSYDVTRGAAAAALEIAQTLPTAFKICFSEHAMRLGYDAAANTATITDAIHFFRLSLNAISGACLISASSTIPDENETSMTSPSIHKMRIKIQLSLAYAFTETNHTDSALACIKAIEDLLDQHHRTSCDDTSSLSSYKQAVAYAKYVIYNKDGDFSAAEENIRKLLNSSHSTPYDLALSIVKSFAQDTPNMMPTKSKLFQLLSVRYPSDPEVTNTRIQHIKVMLTEVETAHPDDSDANNRAVETLTAIVSAHLLKERVLCTAHYRSIVQLIMERVKLHRHMKQWKHLVQWSDVAVRLIRENSEEMELCIAIQLLKTDALINMGSYEEALELAENLIVKSFSTSTSVALFKAMLHARRPFSAAVTKLTEQFNRRNNNATTITGRFSNDNFVDGVAEQLHRLILCCSAVESSHSLARLDKDAVALMLLKEWNQLYIHNNGWKVAVISAETGESFNISAAATTNFNDSKSASDSKSDVTAPSFFNVICEIVRLLMQRYFSVSAKADCRAVAAAEHIQHSTTADFSKVAISDPAAGTRIAPGGTTPPTTPTCTTEAVQNQRHAIVSDVRHDVATLDVTAAEEMEQDISSQSDIYSNRQHSTVQPRSSPQDAFVPPPESPTSVANVDSNSYVENAEERNIATKSNEDVQLDGESKEIMATSIQDTATTDKHFESRPIVVDIIKSSSQPTNIAKITITATSPVTTPFDAHNTGSIATTTTTTAAAKPLAAHAAAPGPGTTGANAAPPPHLSIDDVLSTFGHYDETDHCCSYLYTFRGSMADMRSELLSVFQGVVTTTAVVEKYSTTDLAVCLGNLSDLEWLVRLSWNLGTLMSKETVCTVQEKATTDDASVTTYQQLQTATTTKSAVKEGSSSSNQCSMSTAEMLRAGTTRGERLLVAAQFFEVSEALQCRLQQCIDNSASDSAGSIRGGISSSTHGSSGVAHVVPAPLSDMQVQNQCYCLLTAAALRLDYDTQRTQDNALQHTRDKRLGIERDDDALRENQFSSTVGTEHSLNKHRETAGDIPATDELPASANLTQIATNIKRARNMLDSQIEFQEIDMAPLRKTTLQLEFAAICKLKDNDLCEKFIIQRQNELLQLSAVELQTCKNMLEFEGGGSVDCCRKILNFALQICMRSPHADYVMIGELYCQIIEISPSRQHALERVEDFVQLIQTLSASRRNNYATVASEQHPLEGDPQMEENPQSISDSTDHFDTAIVDQITCMSYNYGITLVDLDQMHLAEKFVANAISLLKYASSSTKQSMQKMEETYLYILKEKGSQQQKMRGDVIRCQMLEATRYVDGTMEDEDPLHQQSCSDFAGHSHDNRRDVARKRSASEAGISSSAIKDAALQLDQISM